MKEKRISASEFKMRCLRLIDQVSRSGEPVTVTKRGKPVVRILAARKLSTEDDYALKGTISMEKDIVSPLGESEWEATS